MRPLLFLDRICLGGAQTQLSLLAQYLHISGHQVQVATYHPSDFRAAEKYLNGIEVVELQKRGRYGANIPQALAKVAKAHKADVLVSFLAVPSLYAHVAKLAFGLGCPLIVGERSAFPGGIPTLRQRLERLFLNRSDAVVANSQSHFVTLSREYPGIRDKLHVVPNAVDAARFSFRERKRSDKLNITSVGRVVPSKNILTFIEALSLVPRELVASVNWYGNAYDEEYLLACNRLLSNLSLSDVWNWKGDAANSEVAFHDADIFVFPSLLEGMPNVVAEAFASGVPCAISDIADARWLAADGERALLFPPTDVSAMANAIIRLASCSAEDYSRMAQSARQFVDLELSVANMGSRYVELMASLVDG